MRPASGLMRRFVSGFVCTLLMGLNANELGGTPVSNISASFRHGQVFVTWDNIAGTNVVYTLYRSPNPIVSGQQLSSAQNLGTARHNSSLNERLSNLLGTRYLRIDSAGAPLSASQGLFVATSTTAGQFYYAVTTRIGNAEDTTIVAGSNSLTAPLTEAIMMPRPVWQENLPAGNRVFEIYAQFTTRITSSIYPQMINVGTFPFHFSIVRGGTSGPHPVTFWLHQSGASFLSTGYVNGIGDPNEWIVTIDDWLPNSADLFAIFYGFHKNYDIFSDSNPVPVFSSDTLYNYVAARIEHTINWCLKNLPLDSTRTYLTGWSMGAIGSIFTSLTIPSKIAAAFFYAPRFNMALDIPSNPGIHPIIRRLWGDYLTNLPTNESFARNERLDANFLADTNRFTPLPVIYSFCGRSDLTVGWDEKPVFYQTGENGKHGMIHFWGPENHQQTYLSSSWAPSFPNFASLARHRTNLSYPAFSGCSINHNPGNGDPGNGDITGTINGHLDWGDNIVDTTGRWEVTLRLRDLVTVNGPMPAPDSASASVTLRRLQRFSIPAGAIVHWQNSRNGVMVQSGSFPHSGSLVTISNVNVYKDSSRLTVTYTPTDVAQKQIAPATFSLSQNYPNPFNAATTISYSLPYSTHVTLAIYNMLAQQVAVLINERKNAGTFQQTWNAGDMPSGVYFYRLQAGGFVATKKLVLVK